MEPDVYSLYSPLKNYLRGLRLNESLLAIHAHLQFQQFHRQLPTYIIGEPFGYRQASTFSALLKFGLFPWELSLLCKEVLLNSQRRGPSHSLLEWHYLSGAVNKLKELEDNITKKYNTKENVLLELFRISHRQFRWQRFPTLETPARYWKIFSYSQMPKIIYESIGLSLEEIITIGMSLLGVFEDKIALFYPPNIILPKISKDKFDIFLKHFAFDFDPLRKRLESEQNYNEKFAYSYSSLISFPLIKKEWNEKIAIVCPIPRYLYERITEGIYYEVYNTTGFDHAFGDAFQNYVGEVAKKLYKNGQIYPEDFYLKNKRTADWIIDDNSATILAECKTKRLIFNAKAELLDTTALEEELTKLATSVVQLYKTMEDFKKNLYPQLKYNQAKPLYPIVVTLENWFLFGDWLVPKLNDLIANLLIRESLSIDLLKSNPYCVLSAETFETLVTIIGHHNIKSVLEEKVTNNEKKTWETETYLRNKYPEIAGKSGCPFVPELEKKIEAIIKS